MTRVIEVMVAVTTLVGLVDAIDARQADLAIVFGIALVLSLVLVARRSVGRRPIAVRADLARWLADRAAVGGEDVDVVADRAIAAYRAGFLGSSDGSAGAGPPHADGHR